MEFDFNKGSFKRDLIIIAAFAVVVGGVVGTFSANTVPPTQGSLKASDTTHSQREISGVVMVTDGDTIKINDTRIRFHGIDAPESGQTCLYGDGSRWNCGETSTNFLKILVIDKTVSCEQKDVDRYDRVVAVCSVDGKDLNGMMVDRGMALAYRSYSDDYVNNEAVAKQSNVGMWGGKFIEPWKWRTGTRLANQVKDGSCNIKGNISSKGEKIYHVPSARYYANTKINEANGERWFCSENEARQAGWRKSKV